MLKPLGRLYCILGIGLVVFSEEYTDGSFDVIRGKFRDQFVNSLCTREDCPPVSCESYNAVCGSKGCQYCVCNKDNQSTTYYHSNDSANGKCMPDSVITRNAGCFNSCDGHSIHTLDTSCSERCIEKVKISGVSGSSNTKCILEWVSSSFSINNQYWKPTEQFLNDFSLMFNNTASPEELYMKLNLEAYKRWAGALLKLQIECHSPPTQPYYSEHFCIIFKFTGKYTPYQAATILTEILVNPTINSTLGITPLNKGMRKPGDQYLASTIALSGILFLVFVFLGFGIFLLLRNNDRRSSAEHTLETDTATTHQEEIQLTV
ncbi:Hypothetical predicted protein [Paramuricea clavata]|uniref:Uncharacterized protein n=1 Tax=Paramuricea clavata TaxID=317549 RepID=A0A6S7I9B2_PARCT|nr:Hypothetical predicted protein [Paramuricea clavata]